jgi:hypothetical protein
MLEDVARQAAVWFSQHRNPEDEARQGLFQDRFKTSITSSSSICPKY